LNVHWFNTLNKRHVKNSVGLVSHAPSCWVTFGVHNFAYVKQLQTPHFLWCDISKYFLVIIKVWNYQRIPLHFHKMYFLIGMGLCPPRPCVNTWTPCPNLIATQEAMRNPLESWKGLGYFVKGDLAETIDLGRWASLLLVVPSFSSCPSWSWCGPSWSPFSLKRTYYCVVIFPKNIINMRIKIIIPSVVESGYSI